MSPRKAWTARTAGDLHRDDGSASHRCCGARPPGGRSSARQPSASSSATVTVGSRASPETGRDAPLDRLDAAEPWQGRGGIGGGDQGGELVAVGAARLHQQDAGRGQLRRGDGAAAVKAGRGGRDEGQRLRSQVHRIDVGRLQRGFDDQGQVGAAVGE
ncbi:hypothetical protein QWU11_41500 [Actinomadura sp. DC4]|nr:hypothetical protein [Actinomadura sp. DC4]MDN3359117.1 hypothetical protein [Actinomadura sp. DC4]